MAVTALGFAACDNYEEPNPTPQNNPQTSILKTEDVTAESGVTSTAYDLKAINNAGGQILLSTLKVTEMPDGYAFKAVGQLSTDDFNSSFELPLTVSDADSLGIYSVTVSPDDLQGVYYNNVSHSPAEGKVSVKYALYTVYSKQEARVGGPDTYYGPYAMSILPFAPERVIEDAYYVVGTASDGTVGQAVKMSHSDINQYDDPVFSKKFDVTPGWKWQVIPASTFAAGKLEGNTFFGVAAGAEAELKGSLVEGGAEGVINEGFPYMLTINMADLTYDFSVAIDQLYTPGNSNGWSQTSSQILTTNDYVNYSGYAYLDGEFKFSSAPNWDGTNFGSTGKEGELTTDGGAGNLNASPAGLYWVNVNIANLTYKIDLVNTYGVIGDATPGGWDATTNLTPSADCLVWKGTIHFKGEGKFKFRANDGWDINLGGDLLNLTPGGDDIPTPGEGDYEVTLNLSQVPYSCTLVKK